MDQRHVAPAGVDQALQISIAPMAAGLAPHQHADIAGRSVVRGVGSSWWSARIRRTLALMEGQPSDVGSRDHPHDRPHRDWKGQGPALGRAEAAHRLDEAHKLLEGSTTC